MIENGLRKRLKEIIAGFQKEVFASEPVVIIGSGGFAQLYKEKTVFTIILPDLSLEGLYQAHQLNSVPS